MNNYTRYLKRLLLGLAFLWGSALAYSYYYSKYAPIPLTSRISLDAKLMFMRDMAHPEKIDTIILGSSIGLNNIHGPTLEKSSKQVNHLLNMSAFSMEVSHTSQLLPLFSFFPNLKRVVYSAQSLDFTGVTPFDKVDIPLLQEYIHLGKHQTNLKFTLLTFKNFINVVKRKLEWKKKHLAHNAFENLDYDHTGGASLHIYGKDIIKRRWNNPFVMPTNKKSYQALDTMIQKLHQKNIAFYLFLEPYRDALVQSDKKLQKILNDFHTQSKAVIEKNHAHFLNLYRKLHLKDNYFADRIHLNDKGNVIIAKEIAHFIDKTELQQGKK